jgi:CubicO group peptidase (beta-lactamase class C family)
LNVPLLQEPGTKWTYGINTDFVGLAVEAASGEKLDVYFKNHITGPLGMHDTAFMPNAEQQSRMVTMHQRQADGSLTPIPPYSSRTPEFFSGGGALYSTLNDYQKFMRMLLSGGAGLLSPETIAAMSSNQIGSLRAGAIPSANPGVIAPLDVFPGMDTKWGLGFLINPAPVPLGRSAGSIAWSGLANTYFWIDPAKGLAALILMQLLPAGDPAAIRALVGFEMAVYG